MPSSGSATRAKSCGGYPPVRFASMCPLEVERDCRMAGQACLEGAVQLSDRTYVHCGAPKNRPAIIRWLLPAVKTA